MKERILEQFKHRPVLSIKDLESGLHLKSTKDFVLFIKTLNQMEEDRILWNDHNHYYLLSSGSFHIGFVKDISRYEWAVIGNAGRVYVQKSDHVQIFDGDEVLVRLNPDGNEVIHIYKHKIHRILGTIKKRRRELVFISDVDYHTRFKIVNEKEFHLKHNDRVVVEIIRYGRPLQIKIVRLIPKEPGNDITAILYAHSIRQEFSEKVITQAKKISQELRKEDYKNRKDLRSLLTVTIDGDDARDFDDAISIVRNECGFTLFVHIADVSYYVTENSPMDQEAYRRGNSVYVCDRVVPMLPFDLSNGICSLNPKVDRCTLTCRMEINFDGRCTKYLLYPSVIHSDCRCTYKKVNRMLQEDPDAIEEYSLVRSMLLDLKECTDLLKKQAWAAGAIDFQTTEASIVLDRNGYAVDVVKKDRGISEEMIEQCMILANRCVAHELNTKELPCMYRIHEKPDPRKIETVIQTALAMHENCQLEQEDCTSKELQQFLEGIVDETNHLVLSMVVLRAMQKARYSEECIGHFGLGLNEYCHFTSPIRRYSDLVVHRMIRKYIFVDTDKEKVSKDKKKIERQSFFISEKEREAITVERAVDDYKKAQYMERRIGRRYTATVVSVTSFGFFVELDNTVEGLVPLRSLNAFYTYDEQKCCLISDSDTIQLGQKVRVVCKDVNLSKGQIEFALY